MTRLTAKQFADRSVKESDVLKIVLRFMRIHPAVDWCERMNTGATKIENRFIRYGFPGLSDIIGQLRDGRMIVVETKSARGRVTPDQAAFLARVGKKGIAIVARSLEDVKPVLDGLLAR